jgi:hypothetical protein
VREDEYGDSIEDGLDGVGVVEGVTGRGPSAVLARDREFCSVESGFSVEDALVPFSLSCGVMIGGALRTSLRGRRNWEES